MHDQWHKALAIAMWKHGLKEIVIREEDLLELNALPDMPVVIAHNKADGLHILLLGQGEALDYIATHHIPE